MDEPIVLTTALAAHRQGVSSVAFLRSGNPDHVRLLRRITGVGVGAWTGRLGGFFASVRSVAGHPDGRCGLAASRDGPVRFLGQCTPVKLTAALHPSYVG